MRVLGLVVTISCACGTATSPTPVLFNAAQDRVTDAPADLDLGVLSFLVGCWRNWSVDWGLEVCWRRASDRWVGRYESYGAMGPRETIDLVVRRRGGRIVMDVRRSAPRADERDREELALTIQGPGYVVFGDLAIQMIGVGPDAIDAKVRATSMRHRLNRDRR